VLSDDDRIRYGRQIIYPGFGAIGQEKLKASHVRVVGVGGLGCDVSMYLAYAYIGHITIVDGDFVELSNLNRQMLHWERDIGKKKPISAFHIGVNKEKASVDDRVADGDEVKIMLATGVG
jgi:molybdopterin/thiamine biosynthesis adenylyltransferase